MMTKQAIKTTMITKIKQHTTSQICQMFEETNNMQDRAIPAIRGMLMDELEIRSSVNFEIWINEEDVEKMDYPSLFY